MFLQIPIYARSLLKAEDATDEEIASSTGLRINMVRKVLYDLFGKSLITGIRVKDERKGWFVFFVGMSAKTDSTCVISACSWAWSALSFLSSASLAFYIANWIT